MDPVLLILTAVFTLLGAAPLLFRAYAQIFWARVSAVVEDCSEGRDADGNVIWRTRFSYHFDGRELLGRSFTTRLYPGSKISIFVSPYDPRRTLVWDRGNYYLGALILAFTTIFWLLLAEQIFDLPFVSWSPDPRN